MLKLFTLIILLIQFYGVKNHIFGYAAISILVLRVHVYAYTCTHVYIYAYACVHYLHMHSIYKSVSMHKTNFVSQIINSVSRPVQKKFTNMIWVCLTITIHKPCYYFLLAKSLFCGGRKWNVLEEASSRTRQIELW